MAERNIKQNINFAIEDLNNIKNAIISKGVEIPNGTPTSQYDEIINSMSNGAYHGSFTLDDDATTVTLSGLPFIPNDIYIYSIDVTKATDITSDSGDKKFCAFLSIDRLNLNNMGVFRAWITSYATPRVGWTGTTRTGQDDLAIETANPNEIIVNVKQLYSSQNLLFKANCKYFYTLAM